MSENKFACRQCGQMFLQEEVMPKGVCKQCQKLPPAEEARLLLLKIEACPASAEATNAVIACALLVDRLRDIEAAAIKT